MLALEERNGPQGQGYEYLMHADDDSFVRLDLLLPLLVRVGWLAAGCWCAAWVCCRTYMGLVHLDLLCRCWCVG